MPWISAASPTISSTRRRGFRLAYGFSKIICTLRRAACTCRALSVLRSVPSSKTSPEDGASKQLTIRPKVYLPQPDSPPKADHFTGPDVQIDGIEPLRRGRRTHPAARNQLPRQRPRPAFAKSLADVAHFPQRHHPVFIHGLIHHDATPSHGLHRAGLPDGNNARNARSAALWSPGAPGIVR